MAITYNLQGSLIAAADAPELGGEIGGDVVLGVQGPRGPEGPPGVSGKDGGYYTPEVTKPDDNTLQFAFTPSNAGMPSVGPVQVNLPAGAGSGGSAAGGNAGFVIQPTAPEDTSVLWVDTDDNSSDGSGNGGTGAGGENGATFTPHVDANGNLSWSNDKGLANPGTVNIRGDRGATGPAGYSPSRGTDYWTDADIAEIKSYVDNAILGGAW